jgi:outer membrane protein, heavy metal efflux system
MHSIPYIRAATAFLALAVWPWTSAAGQASQLQDTVVLNLSEAFRLAADANPRLRAARWRPEAARGDIRSAGTLPFNPLFAFESRSPADGFGSRFEAQVGLEIEMAGQRGLRGRASEAAYSSTQRFFEDEGRLVLAQVGRAYNGLVAAEQRVALVHEIDRLNGQLLAAVQTQREEGRVSVLETNLATIEAARARARSLEAETARTSASLEVSRLLGLEADRPIRTAGPIATSVDSESVAALAPSVRSALERRPDLGALTDAVESARQGERLSRRGAWPNLVVAGLATKEDPALEPRYGVSFGMEIPLFNRLQGTTQRRRAEIRDVEEQRRAVELRVQIEVEDALRAYASTQREVELLEAELLGPIGETHGLLDIAYREGKIDLASVFLLRNQLLDAELSYWNAWERREAAAINLQSATAEILRGVQLTSGSDR